jgi:ADP-ribosylglycohydrolase
MRIAPVGLVASDPFELGCLVAGITHGHILGRQAAGAMALTISALVQGQSLPQAVNALLGNVELDEELDSLVRKAVRLAQTEVSSVDAIEELGEGWVAEEAFAIGLFCALRGPNFEEALSAAVSHSGDSDSTGSIAGQLLGTAGGESVIPARWLDRLELRDVIERAAQDLYDAFAAVPGTDSSVADWDDRYPKA